MEKNTPIDILVSEAGRTYTALFRGLPSLRWQSTAAFYLAVILLIGCIFDHQPIKPTLFVFGSMAFGLLSAVFAIVLLGVAADFDRLLSSGRRVRMFKTMRYITQYMLYLSMGFLAGGFYFADPVLVKSGLQTLWTIVIQKFSGSGH